MHQSCQERAATRDRLLAPAFEFVSLSEMDSVDLDLGDPEIFTQFTKDCLRLHSGTVLAVYPIANVCCDANSGERAIDD